MDEKKYPEPKISEVLIAAGFVGFVMLDFFSAIPGANWITTPISAFINLIVTATGVGGIMLVFAYIVGWIIELVPVLSIFPTLTVIWIITVIFDRRPDLLPQFVREAVEKAGTVAQATKGKGAGGAGSIEKDIKASLDKGRAAAREGKGLEEALEGEFKGSLPEGQGGMPDGKAATTKGEGGGGSGQAEGAEGTEGGPEKKTGEEGLSSAERHGRRIAEGRGFENLQERLLGAPDLQEEIGAPDSDDATDEFGAEEDVGPKMETKPANMPKPANDNNEGYNDSERVNLKDAT